MDFCFLALNIFKKLVCKFVEIYSIVVRGVNTVKELRDFGITVRAFQAFQKCLQFRYVDGVILVFVYFLKDIPQIVLADIFEGFLVQSVKPFIKGYVRITSAFIDTVEHILDSLLTDFDVQQLRQVIPEFLKGKFFIAAGVKLEKELLVLFPSKRHD